MEHTNKVIIDILREEYHDYAYNSWHYDREYRMMDKAISKVKNGETLASEKEFCPSCNRNTGVYMGQGTFGCPICSKFWTK